MKITFRNNTRDTRLKKTGCSRPRNASVPFFVVFFYAVKLSRANSVLRKSEGIGIFLYRHFIRFPIWQIIPIPWAKARTFRLRVCLARLTHAFF